MPLGRMSLGIFLLDDAQGFDSGRRKRLPSVRPPRLRVSPAFHRVGILRIHKILDCSIKIKLASINGVSTQGTLLGIQFVRFLAFQGFDGSMAHCYQVLLGVLSYVGYISKFAHFIVEYCDGLHLFPAKKVACSRFAK